MPRRDLKVVGNHLSRCNDSSPRYERENHYAILARLKISYVLKSQDKHNASYYSKCRASQRLAVAKLHKYFDIIAIRLLIILTSSAYTAFWLSWF